MKKNIVCLAITSVLTASSGQLLADQDPEGLTTNEKDYSAIGIGAASGALIAGPAGLFLGGLIASLIVNGDAESEAQSTPADNNQLPAQTAEATAVSTPAHPVEPEALLLASASPTTPLPGSALSERVQTIIAEDLNIAVYFKPGSVAFESFYTQQLSVLTSLLEEIPLMELQLDAYSDRQGNQSDNLQLSAARLESVRDYFITKGIAPQRIHSRAYGEKNFMSTPGELESYIFDRRVVVSFRLPAINNNVAAITKTAQP